jgi:hypothetical protein
MTENTKKKWDDEATATLVNLVGDTANTVTVALVEKAAEVLGVTTRSVASKLRKLEYTVESMAKVSTRKFSDEESASLAAFVESSPNSLTYVEVAEQFLAGKFSAKQIQGKLLALELTGLIKPAEKVEAVRQYSEAEEATLVKMVEDKAFIEDIAAALNKSLASIRGKALSMSRTGAIAAMPVQRESHAKVTPDPINALGAAIATMTVAEIAATLDKTERGIKTALTRRGIKVADYDGAAKAAKAQGAAEAVAA